MADDAVTAERIVAAHQRLKEEQRAFNRIAKEVDDGYQEKIDKLENHLLGVLNRQGQDSFRSMGCTVYKEKQIIPHAADWDVIYKWIVRNNAWDLLERRLKKTFVSAYMEEHQQQIPPGVSVMQKYVAKVRRIGRSKKAAEAVIGENDDE